MVTQRTATDSSHTLTFVDNLSWVAYDQPTLEQTLANAIKFCADWALPVDWTKSFCWATAKGLQDWWDQTASSLLPPDAELVRVDSAKDLGDSYRFRRGLGWVDLAGRFDEGCRRLGRIAAEARDAQQKSRLVQGGVWPQALYGQEAQLMPLGKVQKLRAAAARAVWGKARSLSVSLAMATGYGGMQDPEVYLLHQAVVAMQRLLRIWPDLGQQALQLTRDFQAQSGRPFGPATTLARLLNRNDWTLQETATLKGPGMEQIDISVYTRRDVRSSLDRAWQVALCPKLAHRRHPSS